MAAGRQCEVRLERCRFRSKNETGCLATSRILGRRASRHSSTVPQQMLDTPGDRNPSIPRLTTATTSQTPNDLSRPSAGACLGRGQQGRHAYRHSSAAPAARSAMREAVQFTGKCGDDSSPQALPGADQIGFSSAPAFLRPLPGYGWPTDDTMPPLELVPALQDPQARRGGSWTNQSGAPPRPDPAACLCCCALAAAALLWLLPVLQVPAERAQAEQMLRVFGTSTEYVAHCKVRAKPQGNATGAAAAVAFARRRAAGYAHGLPHDWQRQAGGQTGKTDSQADWLTSVA